jgi:hypothetical protein
MTISYDIATIFVAGTMVGNEFAIAAFVHPQLGKLNDKEHAHAAALLAAILGKVMPLWYGLTLALIASAAFEHKPISNGPGIYIAFAAILWAATIIFTITMLVPINNRIAKMNPQNPYDGWLYDRARWDRLHRLRVILLAISVLLLLTGIFQVR